MCNSLYELQPQEKETLTEIFEREKKREEHLKQQRLQADNRNRAAERERKEMQRLAEMSSKVDINKQMTDIQTEFEKDLKKAADELYKVYVNDDEMTTVLAERLAHGSEKKAQKDLHMA